MPRSFLKVLAEGLGFKVRFLWFQVLKYDPKEWQKGNASLRITLGKEVKARRGLPNTLTLLREGAK